MPPTPPRPGPTRPSDVVNALIRALWPHPDKRLTDAERAVYEELRAEWARAYAAERDGLVKAA